MTATLAAAIPRARVLIVIAFCGWLLIWDSMLYGQSAKRNADELENAEESESKAESKSRAGSKKQTKPRLREWTSSNGKSISAEYLGVEKGKVSLRTENGKPYHVPLELLSKPDQEFVKKLAAEAPGHDSNVGSLCFSRDGSQLWSSDSSEAFVWDATTGQKLCALTGAGHVNAVADFNDDGTGLAIAGGSAGKLAIWDLEAAKVTQQLRIAENAFDEDILDVEFSKDGEQVLACSPRRTKIWDVSDGSELHSIEVANERADPFRLVAFLADGTPVAITLGTTEGFGMWNARTKEAIRMTSIPTFGAVRFGAAALSADARFFAFADTNDCYVFDTKAGKVPPRIQGSGPSIAISADGRRLLAPATKTVWNAQTRMLTRTLENRINPYKSNVGALSPRGDDAALALDDGAIGIWNTKTGKQKLLILGKQKPKSIIK